MPRSRASAAVHDAIEPPVPSELCEWPAGDSSEGESEQDRDVLYWSAANRLFQVRDGNDTPVVGEIGGEILDLIPAAIKREVSSPSSATTLEFVLITKTEQGLTARSVVRDVGGTFAIDGRLPEWSSTSSALANVQLSAALHLSGQAMSAPAFILPKKYDEKRIEWTFWPVAVDARLYAPVLQFDEAESLRPHRMDIWTRGVVTSSTGGAGLLEWYSTLDASARKPWVYYRVTSYPGSWLIEYWTYYPIDNGHVGPHAHDTERVFVEVDKLGGAPRAVLAAAHLDSSPNNVYSSLDPDDADWPTLPLFAFVELGKHALAPDINRDGFFTFGRDVNGYREVAHVWGVRDYIGRTDDHFNTYRESMMVPRQAEHRMHVAGFDRYFHQRANVPNCAAPSTTCGYELQELPPLAIVRDGRRQLNADIERAKGDIKRGESAGYAALNAKLAEKKLLLHGDALRPERIYRTKVYPDIAFRVGGGYDWFEPFPQVSIGLTFSLRRPFGIRMPVPLPGRIAVEGVGNLEGTERDVIVRVLESGVYVERPLTRHFGRSLQLGLRYQRMTSNMFGFFFGVHRQFQSEIRRPDTRFEREVPIRKFWFRLGPMYESKALSVQVGPAWNWDDLLFEVRANYVLFARKGRSRFGIRD